MIGRNAVGAIRVVAAWIAMWALVGAMVSAASASTHLKSQFMSAAQAHELAGKGALVLVDVRHPTEWKKTGIGATATPISMHVRGFLKKLDQVTGGDKSKPVALICAQGARSARVRSILATLGYTNLIDVGEGMLGSRAGVGWLKAGLPTKPYVP